VTRHPATATPAAVAGSALTFRGLDLWLQIPCAGHVLWAYDETHLDFLERYVAAGIREQAPGNTSLASRLPRWIKARENRAPLVRALARLRASLPE
jgi:hypothetical protein